MLIGFVNIYESMTTNNFMFENDNVSVGDDLLHSSRDLKAYAASKDIGVCTPDTVDLSSIDAFVFIDVPLKDNTYFKYALENDVPRYLLMAESNLLWKPNGNPDNFRYFNKVFTYLDEYIDNKKFFKTNYSFRLPKTIDKSLKQKTKLATMIAGGGKGIYHKKELYTERIKAIRWFEKNHPEDFDLYGRGWSGVKYKFRGPSYVKVLNKLKFLRKWLTPVYPSYKGEVERKRDVLSHYWFSICYENIQGVPGWITEKIFDCFFAGVVPVYLGNITDHIPGDCFIDKSKFYSYEELYQYLSEMKEDAYLNYLNNIEEFLNSQKAYPFSTDYYSKTVIDEITKDMSSKEGVGTAKDQGII